MRAAVQGATLLAAPHRSLSFGMNTHRMLLVLALVCGIAAVAEAQYPHNPGAASRPGMETPATDLPNTGKVLSFIDVPSYTYIEVQLGKKAVWLAATTVKVKKGDVIRFDRGMEMTNFTSSSLKRTFPHILFVSRVVVTSAKA